jgi:hypothetical protein
MKFIIALLIPVSAWGSGLTNAIDEQTTELQRQAQDRAFEAAMREQEEAWDLDWCVKNAKDARTRVLPTCEKLPANESCAFMVKEFYRRKCHRWGL